MTYITAPASIDNSGKTDVSVALSDWLCTTRAKTGRTQLKLRRNGTNPGVYRCEASGCGRTRRAWTSTSTGAGSTR